jgi:hypothetical protein
MSSNKRMEAAVALGLVWPKEEERVGGLGQPKAKAQGGSGRLGWKQGVQAKFGKRRKINSKLILSNPRL